MLQRRRAVVCALVGAPLAVACSSIAIPRKESASMYGLIGRIRSVAGQRDALASILLEGSSGMPGCLSFIVAADAFDPDALWVTEVWQSAAEHRASLSLSLVQQAIKRGKPLIAGFGERFETSPIGGVGLQT
jgi:quinol monooxygenase YgiN